MIIKKIKKWMILLVLIIFAMSCEMGVQTDNVVMDKGNINEELPDTQIEDGLEIDLNQLTSRAISSSPYLKVIQSNGQYLITVNLRPSGYTYYEGAIVEVSSTSTASGWRVNIGNSPTNNGYGGDAGSTSYDSELQLLNNDFSVYANDHGGSGRVYYRKDWGDQRKYKFEIQNNYVVCRKYNALGVYKGGLGIRNSNIFNLNSNAGYTFYVGINRTITSSRYGSGMYNVKIRLIKPRTGVYLAVTSIANFPGSYTFGHMGVVAGSDTNNLGWYFFSIERDNAPYIKPWEVIWKHKLPPVAVGSVSGGAEYSVLYYHREATREALFNYLANNAPGINNSGTNIITGQGYDRYALLNNDSYTQTKGFINFIKASQSSEYNALSNNCASFSTFAIEDYYNVECNNNTWHIPNDLFDDLYDNASFTITQDNRLDK